jgi:cysteine desulfurase
VLGKVAREAVEDARGRVAGLLGADREEVVFTSGGTESNNLALFGPLQRGTVPLNAHLVISALEHPAVCAPAKRLKHWGAQVTVVPCDSQGMVDPADIKKALRPNTRMVSIMHANNEIGTIQPIQEIARVCREHGVLLHTDAAQSAGKIPTRVEQLGADLLSIAGHKLYGPKGVGALLVRRSVELDPVLCGAGQERGLRPGTENVASIVGLGAAAELARRALETEHQRLESLRDRLAAALAAGIPANVTVNGAGAPRLPNTLSVNFPQVSGAELLRRVPELAASTGAACHATEVAMSATLQAIGLQPEVARGTVRLSVGWYTSEEDIDRAANALIHAWESLA